MRIDQARAAARGGLTALLALSAVACQQDGTQTALGSTTQTIIGGVTTPAHQAGFMAALIQDFGHGLTSLHCGGAFVAPDLVVTAGHCSFDLGDRGDATNQLIHQPLDPSRLRVARRPAGLSTLSEPELLRVDRIYVHPDFAYSVAAVNDIALWKLASPSPGPTLQIAAPRLVHQLERWGGSARAYGYGRTSLESDAISDVLRQVDLPLMAPRVCREIYYEALNGAESGLEPHEIITDTMLCAGGEGGRDPCGGDSGGPLVARVRGAEQLVGLVSWGKDCALPGVPGVFTRVDSYRDWIRACARGECEAKTQLNTGCVPGYADCDGNPDNGCERNLRSVDHCGACAPDSACHAGEACVYDRDGGDETAHCAAALPIIPRLECVYPLEDGFRAASFGYTNLNQGSVYVRRGPDNRFQGLPDYAETITQFPGLEEFQPGSYRNAPIALLGPGPARWTLRGPDGVSRSVEVDQNAPRCSSHPSTWEGEQQEP